MTKIITKRNVEFEEAFKAISLSTWNRPRTTNELMSFLERREAVVEAVEL